MEKEFSINIKYNNYFIEKEFDEIPLIVEEAISDYLNRKIPDEIEVLCVEM